MVDYLHLLNEAKFNIGQLFKDLNTGKDNKPAVSPGTGEVVRDTSFVDDLPVSKTEAARLAKKKASSINKIKPVK